jgi:hypothetical protein
VGTQHVIDEHDLDEVLDEGDEMLPVPERWRRSERGERLPNVVGAVGRSRSGH